MLFDTHTSSTQEYGWRQIEMQVKHAMKPIATDWVDPGYTKSLCREDTEIEDMLIWMLA